MAVVVPCWMVAMRMIMCMRVAISWLLSHVSEGLRARYCFAFRRLVSWALTALLIESLVEG